MTYSLRRFEVLDSFRGLAALMVAFFHFMVIDGQSDLFPDVKNEVIHNLWLFTDFFFVLSGFILSYRYYSRATPLASLLKARFFRLFPLHLFTTFVACGLVLAADGAPKDFVLRILANITNLQIFFPGLDTLNGPSWSISVEFYFSLLLGGIFMMVPSRFLLASIMIVLLSAAGLMMLTDTLSVTYGIGWLRGLLGLAVGCLTWWGYQKLDCYKLSYRTSTILEVFLLLLLVESIIFYKVIWFLAPVFLYGLIVLLFAREAGWLSAFTKKKFFLFMGKISYSLYLNHLMVLLLLQSFLLVMGVTHDMIINSSNPLILPAGLVVYFGILIPCSAWTYKNVELYWQKKRNK